MSDLIRREEAYAAIRGLTRHIDRIAAITALPAVQPDARIKEYEEAYQYALHLAEALRENYPPNPDFQFLGGLVGLLTQIDNMVAGLSQPAVQSFDCECGQVGPCNSQFCTPRAALKGETP